MRLATLPSSCLRPFPSERRRSSPPRSFDRGDLCTAEKINHAPSHFETVSFSLQTDSVELVAKQGQLSEYSFTKSHILSHKAQLIFFLNVISNIDIITFVLNLQLDNNLDHFERIFNSILNTAVVIRFSLGSNFYFLLYLFFLFLLVLHMPSASSRVYLYASAASSSQLRYARVLEFIAGRLWRALHGEYGFYSGDNRPKSR